MILIVVSRMLGKCPSLKTYLNFPVTVRYHHSPIGTLRWVEMQNHLRPSSLPDGAAIEGTSLTQSPATPTNKSVER